MLQRQLTSLVVTGLALASAAAAATLPVNPGIDSDIFNVTATRRVHDREVVDCEYHGTSFAILAPVVCGRMSDYDVASSNQYTYTIEQVCNSYMALIKYSKVNGNDKPKAGNVAYPHQFGKSDTTLNPNYDPKLITALDKLKGCETGQTGYKYFEFPLTTSVFTGGAAESQGPDRVLAISKNVGQKETRQFTYCLSMTHRGEPASSFAPCDE